MNRNYRIQFILFFSIIAIASCKTSEKSSFPEKIGDIDFDPLVDRKDFYLCDPSQIVQYYNIGTTYSDEHGGLENDILKNLQLKQGKNKSESGFITVRFVVNCKGETDRFRVYELDQSLQKKKFETELVNSILTAVKKLDKWKVGSNKNEIMDSYFRITFKIVNGEIKSIRP